MNLSFNEISFQPEVDNEQSLKEKFMLAANILKIAKEKYGFSHLVFTSDLSKTKVINSQTFYEWVYSIPHQGDKNKILGLIKRPYINDVLQDQVGDLDAFYFENLDLHIEPTYCHGLATAYITETASLSLHTHSFWEQKKLVFFKENLETKVPDSVYAHNLCLENCFDDNVLKTYFESIAKVDLAESPLNPNEKTHHFRDDHGTDILTAFSKRIKNSKYVNTIINSLPFNSHTSQFIRRIYQDGKIEIVLHWEDKGYGMVIQSTGRNFRETKAIAQILKDEYDK